MKKLFTILFALVATTALWAEDFEVNGIYYTILTDKTNEVEVTFRGSDYDSYNEYTGSVTIPSSVTYNGTTYSVTSIGYSAFENCSSLTSITIPNSVTSIGFGAFADCDGLTSVTIPNSVKSIGDYAFYLCDGLTSVTIPNSVTSIGERAFAGCSGLTSPVYNAHCFAYMPTSYSGAYTIPEGIKQIAGSAFYGCYSLTSITIPNSVTSIRRDAFSYCYGLTSVTIPNSVTYIGNSAFSSCSSLTSIIVEDANSTYDSRENCNAIIETATNTLIAGCQNTIIPNSVTSIGSYAFEFCDDLTSVTIGNSVTSIGRDAFSYCYGLTSVTSLAEIPPTLGTDAFYNVSNNIPVYVPCGAVSAYQLAGGWEAFTNIQEPLAEHSITVGVNDSIMGTAKVDYTTPCEGAQITATANYRYRFVQWSDGNTDNPRVVVLTQDTTFTAEFAVSYSGQCGDNLGWAYDEANKTISITGSGDMYDYTKSTQPWLFFQEQITEVTTSNTTTSIGTSAFAGCTGLNLLRLGTGIQNIDDNAFANCTKLYDIYCLAAEPPTGYTSSFANYNAFLHVPCESQRLYMLDILFGEFKYIECIASDEVPTDDIVITPGSTDVTITWPTEENADTYSIVIKKDGKVVCTLTFNSNGQLLNIAFAPGREGNHPAQYAEATANGYRFTVTGLNEGTDYTYTVTSKDAANKTISEHSGEFTTQSTTALDNINSQSPMTNVQKISRDGQLLIIRDGKTYNAQGVEL